MVLVYSLFLYVALLEFYFVYRIFYGFLDGNASMFIEILDGYFSVALCSIEQWSPLQFFP